MLESSNTETLEMESSFDHHEDSVVSFDLVGDPRVSGYGKGVVMASDERISIDVENGGNVMRLDDEGSRSGLVDDPNIGTNLVVLGMDRKVSKVGELHAINLVVDLSQCCRKEANDVLSVASSKLAKIIECVHDLAKDPFGITGLEVSISTMEAQLSAFNHWKGYHQLHINEILDGLDDKFDYDDSEEVTETEKLNECSRKRKHVFDGGLSPTKKVKCLSDLMSKSCPSLTDVEYTPNKRGRKRKNLELNRDEFLSLVRYYARNPTEKRQNLESLVKFSTDFRNYRLETKSQLREEIEIQPEGSEEHDFTGIKDSYWTDRIIEFTPDEKVMADFSSKSKKENSATALILKFTDLESAPSLTKLNEIFGRYGPLLEYETQVLKKKKCVKMVFERRCDAETAFSSSGKFSIFGPALVSYCLNFSPTPRKRGTAGRNRNKKGMKSAKRMQFED